MVVDLLFFRNSQKTSKNLISAYICEQNYSLFKQKKSIIYLIDSFHKYLTLVQGLHQLTVLPLIQYIYNTILYLSGQSFE